MSVPSRKLNKKERERQEAIDYLKGFIKPGDTLYTTVTHVSRSGMMRHIKVMVCSDGEVTNISGYASTALDWPWADDGTVKVSGCGMDMGFHLVHSLSSTLFCDGWQCVGDGGEDYKKRCPNNSHVNSGPDRENFTQRHEYGGYALRHKWI